MDNFDFDDVLNAMASNNGLLDEQKENIEQERHEEILESQSVSNENLQEINRRLQTQIDENRLTEEKHDKRSKKEFRLSFAVAIVSAAIALAALLVAIFK